MQTEAATAQGSKGATPCYCQAIAADAGGRKLVSWHWQNDLTCPKISINSAPLLTACMLPPCRRTLTTKETMCSFKPCWRERLFFGWADACVHAQSFVIWRVNPAVDMCSLVFFFGRSFG